MSLDSHNQITSKHVENAGTLSAVPSRGGGGGGGSGSGGLASKKSHNHSRPLWGGVTVLGGHKGPSDTPQQGHGLDLFDDGNPSRGGDGPRPYGLSELVHEALSYLCMRP